MMGRPQRTGPAQCTAHAAVVPAGQFLGRAVRLLAQDGVEDLKVHGGAPAHFPPAYDLREVLTKTALTACWTLSLLHFGHGVFALSCSLMLITVMNP